MIKIKGYFKSPDVTIPFNRVIYVVDGLVTLEHDAEYRLSLNEYDKFMEAYLKWAEYRLDINTYEDEED